MKGWYAAKPASNCTSWRCKYVLSTKKCSIECVLNHESVDIKFLIMSTSVGESNTCWTGSTTTTNMANCTVTEAEIVPATKSNVQTPGE